MGEGGQGAVDSVLGWLGMVELPAFTLRRNPRSRCVRLAIYRDGRFIVTAPMHADQRLIERFVREKAAWVQEKLAYVQALPPPLLPRSTKKDYLMHKTAAMTLVTERLAHFNTHYQQVFTRVCIRDQRSRWGSCSRRGNLNFNYRIVLLPPSIADYIIVHELCHLREFNHSPRFWALVAEMIPEYRECRATLRKHPLRLS
ncbi:MAG: SprT family zinc-dependent metalloprotease [Patescibacteria group bacterium]